MKMVFREQSPEEYADKRTLLRGIFAILVFRLAGGALLCRDRHMQARAVDLCGCKETHGLPPCGS